MFSISVPGHPRQFSHTPVSLIDIYPTLLSLCGLDQPTRQVLDGIDLAPVLKGETKERGRPVLSTYTRGNHTVRSNRYRYIRYANGDEELYDHDADPHEWENLADHPDLEPVKKEMRRWLPQRDAPSIGNGTNWKGSVK